MAHDPPDPDPTYAMLLPRPRRRRPPSPVREHVRDALWVVPTLGIAAGWFLAGLALRLDPHVQGWIADTNNPWLTQQYNNLRNVADSAQAAVGTMSSGMLTFIGVVFSITLVALQMAASQFGQRVLRIYVRSRITKFTFGLFLATFLYTLRVQKEFDSEAANPPVLSASLATGLVVLSLLLFVFYVHSTVKLMRVTYVMEFVTRETLNSLSAHTATYGDAGTGPDPADLATAAVLPHVGRPGVMQDVKVNRIVWLARRHGVVLRLYPRVGDFVAPGTALAEVRGTPNRRGVPGATQLAGAVTVGRERTMAQDFTFGLRQLVDIAIRALSPAVNDPTTAVQALDHIQIILTAAMPVPLSVRVHRDLKGVVRAIEPVHQWDDIVDLSFTEIRVYGATSPQVARRMTAALEDLAQLAPPKRHGAFVRHQRLLRDAVDAGVRSPDLREMSQAPDRQGIG